MDINFEIIKLPKEETIAGKCPKEKEVYNAFGYIQVKPSNCILPAIYENSLHPIRNMPIREDDVFVVSNPKCGTTWLLEMVWLIANNADEVGAEVLIDKRIPHLDVQGCVTPQILDMIGGDILKNAEKRASPRFFKSHLPKELLPKEIWEKKAKIIFITRDPKDAVVSNYHHYKLFHSYEGTLDEFIEAFLDDKVMYSPFWEHAIDFWEIKDEPNILCLTFEDMKKDRKATILKIAKFLNVELTDEQMQIILKRTSFQFMKGNKAVNYEEVKEFVTNDLNRELEDGSFIREGQSDTADKKMKAEYVERINEKTRLKFKDTGLELLYC